MKATFTRPDRIDLEAENSAEEILLASLYHGSLGTSPSDERRVRIVSEHGFNGVNHYSMKTVSVVLEPSAKQLGDLVATPAARGRWPDVQLAGMTGGDVKEEK